MHQRRFLLVVAASVVAIGAASSRHPTSSQSISEPRQTKTISDVKHIIIFIQENRSFDHIFGTLSGVRGFGDRYAVSGPTQPNTFYQFNGKTAILPFHSSATNISDVGHFWTDSQAAVNGGLWDRWTVAKGNETMVSYNRTDLPYYYALADSYTICDDYHCSFIGSTNPNRLYSVTGSVDPQGKGGGPVLGNNEPPAGFTWTTYPERLQKAGISWKVYQQADNFDDNALAWFANFINAKPGNPLYNLGRAVVSDVATALTKDIQNNALPTVSWIVAPTSLSEHPDASIQNGEVLTDSILKAVQTNTTVAKSTALFLTYDENGGFFDHSPAPLPPSGTADEFVSNLPLGLGVRVPLIVISPWTRGGVVCSQVFDHTSLIRFLEQVTKVQEPNISAWRRQVCGDLTSAFDFAHPDYTVPTLPKPVVANNGTVTPTPPAIQAIPKQEKGTKVSRALPYLPNVSSSTDVAHGNLTMTMTNSGTASTHLTVYSLPNKPSGPWPFDVKTNSTVTGLFTSTTLQTTKYDLTCHGPNGFVRRFAGDIKVDKGQIEVTSSFVPSTLSIVLTLKNGSTSPVTFKVKANAFRTDGPWSYTVPAGKTLTPSFTTANGWYDLSVTSSSNSGFLRQLAGRIENGKPGVTDNFGTN